MIKKLCVAVLANCLAFNVLAQGLRQTEVTVDLTSEGQINLSNNKANWINLLEVGIETPLGKNFRLISHLLSVQNTRMQKGKEGRICNDLQIFSNIEEENCELSFFAFGPEWNITENFRTFLGIRNVNRDYFNSPLTSLFSGSSQGIYPTLSENWGLLSNYPLSALCLHLEWNLTGNWELKNSFYNGVASTKLTKSFRFRPGRDGIFNITQLGYAEPKNSNRPLGQYYIGMTYGNTPEEEGAGKHSYTSYYGLIEQPLIGGLGLLLEGSWASTSQSCHAYYAGGLVYTDFLKENTDLGVMINRALFRKGRETDVEVTCSIPVSKHMKVQPCVHFIHTTGSSHTVGMLRVNISL